jgi:hypothetical protein
MPYVSSYLTHFVGRSLSSDQSRYELLSKIIHNGVLLDAAHIGRRDPIFRVRMQRIPPDPLAPATSPGLDYSSYPNVRHDTGANLSDNTLVQFEIVCFCDIPEEELAIHCSKYSHFGLSFSKQFLIGKGASPVMYVPKPGWYEVKLRSHDRDSGKLDKEIRTTGERAALIDRSFEFHNHQLIYKRFMDLQERMREAFRQLQSFEDVRSVEEDLHEALLYQTAVEAFIFGYLKFFDPTLPSDHIENYYMEREWRVAGRVEFKLEDIESMYVPPAFLDQALQDFPALNGRVRSLTPAP